MERPWRKPGPLSFRYCVGAWARMRQPPILLLHKWADAGAGDRARLEFCVVFIPYPSSTARFLSHETTIANPDCRCYRPMARHCSLWTEFAKADHGGSAFNLPFTQQIGEVNPSTFGTLFRLVQLQREVVMKALFGTLFGSAMLLASGQRRFRGGGYLQASSEEDQIAKEPTSPNWSPCLRLMPRRASRITRAWWILDQTGPTSRLSGCRLAAGAGTGLGQNLVPDKRPRTSITATANSRSLAPTSPSVMVCQGGGRIQEGRQGQYDVLGLCAGPWLRLQEAGRRTGGAPA